MKMKAQFHGLVFTLLILIADWQKAWPAPPANKDWQSLSKAGNHIGALRVLDDARLEIVKKYGADLEKVLPKRILAYTSATAHVEIGAVNVAVQQTYRSDMAEVFIVLQAPTVDLEHTARLNDSAVQQIKECLRKGKKPVAEQVDYYLVLQKFASQLQHKNAFAKRPQLLAYLSNGATITISAMTDTSLEDFYKFVDTLPFRKLDQVITGEHGKEK
jgi:hypothetical protein